jgi:ComF family protein
MPSPQFVDICKNIKQRLFPLSCLLCGAADAEAENGLCPACLQDLPWLPSALCPQCALASPNSEICGHCLRSPPAFDRTLALLGYRHPLDALLQRYKYDHQLSLAHTFATLLQHRLAQSKLPELLIPMPLHAARLRERGFNQALEIARPLASQLGLPLAAQCCTRIRMTAPQVSLPLKRRIANMRGAFACTEQVAGRHVALLDDVMTTAASLNALAQTVLAAGAIHVECWVVARTLPE